MAEFTEEQKAKLRKVSEAIDNLEGIAIPFNIIRQNIVPFANWFKEVLCEEIEDVDDEPDNDPGPDYSKEIEDLEGPELPSEGD